MLFKSQLIGLVLLELILFLVFLFADTVGLSLVDSQFVVGRGVLLKLLFELLAFALQAGSVGSKPFKLSLSGHRLLEEDLDLVESLLLVIELSADNIVADLAVGADFLFQVVQHLLGADVFARLLLDVHQALTGREELMFGHFEARCKFALLFTESGIVLLLFPQLGSSVEKLLEVSLVTLAFEKVDLRKELVFLLFELGDLFFELVWVH